MTSHPEISVNKILLSHCAFAIIYKPVSFGRGATHMKTKTISSLCLDCTVNFQFILSDLVFTTVSIKHFFKYIFRWSGYKWSWYYKNRAMREEMGSPVPFRNRVAAWKQANDYHQFSRKLFMRWVYLYSY